MSPRLINRAEAQFKQSDRRREGGLVFEYSLDVFLKDASPYGTVYFARFFEWQGMCREAFWQHCLMPTSPPPTLQLITKSASMEYITAAYPFRKVVVYLSVMRVRPASTVLYISCHDHLSNQRLADGFQTIVFADATRSAILIPPPIRQVLTTYILD